MKKNIIKALILSLILLLSSFSHQVSAWTASQCLANPDSCVGWRPRPPSIPCPGIPNCWLDPFVDEVSFE